MVYTYFQNYKNGSKNKLNVNPDTGELFATGREQAEYLKKHAKENCGVVILVKTE